MFATLLALSLTAHADPPKNLPESAINELKKLEGKWKLELTARNGNERAPSDEGVEVFLTFKGRKVILREDNKETEIFEISTLDTTTNPKLLDFKLLVNREPWTKGTVVEAIYKLDEKALTVAI